MQCRFRSSPTEAFWEIVLIRCEVQQQAKVGLAVSIEVASEEVMTQAGPNAGPPSVPF